MKTLSAIALLSLCSSVWAGVPKLEACDASDMKMLNESIADAKQDGFKNVKLMKNNKGQTVGFFSWGTSPSTIKSEICEYVATDDMTAASSWFYWDNERAFKVNPASWVKEGVYDMSQDEGAASMRLLKESRTGDVTVELTVKGMGEDNFVDIRKDIITFSTK